MKPKMKQRRRQKVHKAVTEVRHSSRKLKAVIPALHQLNCKRQKLAVTSDGKEATKRGELQRLQHQIEELGGLNTYQQLSKMGESCHGNQNTAKWVVKLLKRVKMKDQMKKGARLTLLDVGALNMNYESHHSWIDCKAIDLNPQHLKIERADFLHYKTDEWCMYDVIVLSLVLNFPGDLEERGRMLRHAVELTNLHGYLFIMLPAACVDNSRYLTRDLLMQMMTSLGCHQVATHTSSKLVYLMYERMNLTPSAMTFPKKQVNPGPGRNNFCIIVK